MSLRDLAAAAGLSPDDHELLEQLLREEGVQLEEGTGIPSGMQSGANEEAPLSFSQERLWFLDRLTPGTADLQHARAAAPARRARRAGAGPLLRGDRPPPRGAAHRASPPRNGEAVQIIDPPAPRPLPRVDLAGLPDRRAAPGGGAADGGRRRAGPSTWSAALSSAPSSCGWGPRSTSCSSTMHHIVVGRLVHGRAVARADRPLRGVRRRPAVAAAGARRAVRRLRPLAARPAARGGAGEPARLLARAARRRAPGARPARSTGRARRCRPTAAPASRWLLPAALAERLRALWPRRGGLAVHDPPRRLQAAAAAA